MGRVWVYLRVWKFCQEEGKGPFYLGNSQCGGGEGNFKVATVLKSCGIESFRFSCGSVFFLREIVDIRWSGRRKLDVDGELLPVAWFYKRDCLIRQVSLCPLRLNALSRAVSFVASFTPVNCRHFDRCLFWKIYLVWGYAFNLQLVAFWSSARKCVDIVNYFYGSTQIYTSKIDNLLHNQGSAGFLQQLLTES